MKNYSSILAIVNHRNWLDDSPPLSFLKTFGNTKRDAKFGVPVPFGLVVIEGHFCLPV